MPRNRAAFLDFIRTRLIKGKIRAAQVEGLDAILDLWQVRVPQGRPQRTCLCAGDRLSRDGGHHAAGARDAGGKRRGGDRTVGQGVFRRPAGFGEDALLASGRRRQDLAVARAGAARPQAGLRGHVEGDRDRPRRRSVPGDGKGCRGDDPDRGNAARRFYRPQARSLFFSGESRVGRRKADHQWQ